MLLADASHWKNHRRLQRDREEGSGGGAGAEVEGGGVLMVHFIALYC